MTRNALARAARLGRAVLIGLLFAAAAVVPPLAWGVGNLVLHARAGGGVPDARPMPADAPAPAAHDPARRTAVVITGNGGAEMTDFLMPYEALGRTGAFNLYVVAPERRVIPLANAGFRDGGLDLVPDYGIDEFDRAVGVTPDVIVVPFLPAFLDGEERGLVPWIRKHADAGALVVSICAGAEVVAAAGLLDGRRATTHPSFLERLDATYPAVTWERHVRYVATDRTISSGAIASGLDAALAAIQRLLGRAAADDVARALGYPHTRFLDDPSYATGFAMGAFLGAAVSPRRRTLGVLLHDGVSEVAVGSLFDTYPTTLSTNLRAVAARPGVIRTRHGMTLVPRGTLVDAGDLDGLLVPGADVPDGVAAAATAWARARDVDATFVHARWPGFAYDGALAHIAARDGRLAAEAVAVNLNYPADHLALDGVAVPAGVVVIPALLSLLGVLALAWIRRRLRARRARRAGGTLRLAAAA